MRKNGGKTALVLSAGGMFGAYQAGAYRAIRQQFEPDIIVGASVGALNGWAMASRCTPEHLIDQWLDPSAGETLRMYPNAGWLHGWFDPAPLRAQSQRLFDGYTPVIPFGLVVTEVPSLTARLILDRHVQPEHLQATCSIPVFLPSVKIGGKRFLDGGLFEKLPLWAALEMGATRIIAIDSLPRVGKWWLHWGIEIAHAFKPRRKYSPQLDLTIISASETLGDANAAVFWKRENIERWVDLGARDAAHALRQAEFRRIVNRMKRLAVLLVSTLALFAQGSKIVLTPAEQSLADRTKQLRSLPDTQRPTAAKDLALAVRRLPDTPGKQALAIQLANLVTEGDPGQETLQQTATTLAESLNQRRAESEDPYFTLAQLVRYEHVQASVDDPRFRSAIATLTADDDRRQKLDFTLTDLAGKSWTLRQLTGKVVVVNFWATWCPPCRKEMPDLDALYRQFQSKGLVILALSNEERDVVSKYLSEHPVSYPILLDPGNKVTDSFVVRGIPKTFVYDRSGRLAAESIDMRTRRQFLAMLAQAGLTDKSVPPPCSLVRDDRNSRCRNFNRAGGAVGVGGRSRPASGGVRQNADSVIVGYQESEQPRFG